MSLVICLQFYEGDIAQARTLAEFIAEIEPKKRDDVRVRFVARGDCDQMDMGTIQLVSHKFDVSWIHANTKVSGWPAGPNALAMEILSTAPAWLKAAGWSDADGILLLEPDCCPLQRDWLDQILAEWAIALAERKWIMGSWRASGPNCGHVNGNCVVVPDIGKRLGIHYYPEHLAWDCWIAQRVQAHWRISGAFLNKFQSVNATEEILRTPEVGTEPPAIVHGYKDDSAYLIARKWILP